MVLESNIEVAVLYAAGNRLLVSYDLCLTMAELDVTFQPCPIDQSSLWLKGSVRDSLDSERMNSTHVTIPRFIISKVRKSVRFSVDGSLQALSKFNVENPARVLSSFHITYVWDDLVDCP